MIALSGMTALPGFANVMSVNGTPRVPGGDDDATAGQIQAGVTEVAAMPKGLAVATSVGHPGCRPWNVRSVDMSMFEHSGSKKPLPGPHSQAYQPILWRWQASNTAEWSILPCSPHRLVPSGSPQGKPPNPENSPTTSGYWRSTAAFRSSEMRCASKPQAIDQ